MKVLVLAGGLSPERNVSLVSGTMVANALMKKGHRVLLADLYCGIPTDAPTDSLFCTQPLAVPVVGNVPPDLDALVRETDNGGALIGRRIMEAARAADVCFLALHGGIGENGRLQATLDTHGVRYTGSGCEGSMLAMSKLLSKQLFRAEGIPTPDWVTAKAGQSEEAFARDVVREVGIPCVVKPDGCGSSVGISLVRTGEQLLPAIRAAMNCGGTVFAERMVVGRELTVAVLNGVALPPVEIIPPEGEFYDYENKYNGKTRELCPAPISQALTEEVSRLAVAGMRALHLSGYARFDFLTDGDGAWCIEANTLPGMTPTSLLPLAASRAGIGYEELCETVLHSATEKN